MTHPIYHLDFAVKDCRVEVRLNDVFVADLVSRDGVPATFAPPLNPWLVGDLNVIDVHLFPTTKDDQVTTFWDAHFKGAVRRYVKGDVVAPGEGPLVSEMTIPEELRERVREEELELPQSFSHVFSNDVVDFSSELNDGPLIEDQAAVLDYGVHLRDLVRARSTAALMTEFDPKIRVWSQAYDEPYDNMRQVLEDDFGKFFGQPPITDFEREELELRRHAGGRIWEIRLRDGAPLIRNEPDAEMNSNQYRVFVGLRDEHLRVVR